jgi:uncharacterized repeat protein (TIGR01451 family)
MAVTTSPAGYVEPGGTIQYTLQIRNGDSVTETDWSATQTIPDGTVLVPHSQTCGANGGTCSESWTGSVLQWAIPAGARPSASFVMSFSVAVSPDNPPPEIVGGLTFTGPGCQANATCTHQAPSVATSGTTRAGAVPVPPQTSSAAPVESSEPPTTVPGADDGGNLIVQVPDCHARGKKVRCKEPALAHGLVAQVGNPGATGGQGLSSGLAATGDNEVRSAEAAVVLVLCGSFLLVASRFTGRRGAPP